MFVLESGRDIWPAGRPTRAYRSSRNSSGGGSCSKRVVRNHFREIFFNRRIFATILPLSFRRNTNTNPFVRRRNTNVCDYYTFTPPTGGTSVAGRKCTRTATPAGTTWFESGKRATFERNRLRRLRRVRVRPGGDSATTAPEQPDDQMYSMLGVVHALVTKPGYVRHLEEEQRKTAHGIRGEPFFFLYKNDSSSGSNP